MPRHDWFRQRISSVTSSQSWFRQRLIASDLEKKLVLLSRHEAGKQWSRCDISNLGIQIRNTKMVFNFYCTWRRVTFEKLMMKIYDFFFIRLSHLVTHIVQKSLRRWKIFYTILYGVTKWLILCKNHCKDGRFFTQYYTGWLKLT